MKVTVESVEIFGRPAEGSAPNGIYLTSDGFTGWDSSTDVRRDEVTVPQGHGSFDSPGFRAARVVSLAGVIVSPSEERTKFLGLRLTGLLADGDSGRVVVERKGYLWADARLAAATKCEARGATPWIADWQMQLWFPDPRRYGETRVFASGAAAFHYGNFPSTPYMQVAGSMPGGYTINGPGGKKFTVTAAVVSGNPHYIDMSTGILRVGGYPLFGVVSQGDTWSIPGGQNLTMTLVPVSGSGTLTVSVVDTYV